MFRPYLRETRYCDFGHDLIRGLHNDLVAGEEEPREKAVRMFYWVRDNIKYRVGYWNSKASETLIIGKGTCTNKANLLVALLRASGIPAGYGVMKVKGEEYLGPIVLPIFKDLISKIGRHIYCYVHLEDRWIKCDPSDDQDFVEQTGYFNPTSTLVDWNGREDALLNLAPDHILRDEGPADSIDHLMDKKLSMVSRSFVLRVANLYIDFLRENNRRIDDIECLQRLFQKWLKKNHLSHYCLFNVVSLYLNMRTNNGKAR